jgi:Polyphosphate kinase N-terminal domain
VPLLERAKFLAIVHSSLDEFFMKRIRGLKQQLGARVQTISVDRRTPAQQSTAHGLRRRLPRGRWVCWQRPSPLGIFPSMGPETFVEAARRAMHDHPMDTMIPNG